MGTLDINAIRDYLIQVGCKIEYPILVNAFKQHLYNEDPNKQSVIRTKFKDYVNRLATVSLENNMKFIILREEFRPTDQQISADKPMTVPSSPTTPQKQPANNNLHNNKITSTSRASQTLTPMILPLKQQQTFNQQFQQPSIQKPETRVPISPLKLQHHLSPPPPLPPQQQQLPQQPTIHRVVQPTRHTNDVQDSASTMPPPMVTRRSQPMQRPESLNMTSTQMPPPNPPPRRRQSNASLFKQLPRPIDKNSVEIHELARKGRVREHALKLNSFSSSSDLNSLMPMKNSSMKENRLSRENTMGSISSMLQRNGSHLVSRSRSSHREDESDSSSLQPIDPLGRKWAIEACNCNYNGLLCLLREDPKLGTYKDIVNGYTALHWAAKFGNLDIIKLMAGTHGVSTNIKSSAGYTPLHVAYMFNKNEVVDLLIKSYKANPDLRDHSGKRPQQYCQQSPKN